jgi:hypothetical protein
MLPSYLRLDEVFPVGDKVSSIGHGTSPSACYTEAVFRVRKLSNGHDHIIWDFLPEIFRIHEQITAYDSTKQIHPITAYQ